MNPDRMRSTYGMLVGLRMLLHARICALHKLWGFHVSHSNTPATYNVHMRAVVHQFMAAHNHELTCNHVSLLPDAQDDGHASGTPMC